MKDRLPRTTNIALGIGDDITFRDGITGKLYDGRIVGFEGPTALIKYGNSDRRVPSRELLPRRQIRQDHDSETESENEGESETDKESIPEIRPTRRGPQRKRKPEIIPEILAFKIKKPKQTSVYKEGEILQDLWTGDEAEDYKTKVQSLSMPKKGEYIDMWDSNGKKFVGKVIQCRKNHFFIIESGTTAQAWIYLNRLNYWSYQLGKKSPVSTDITGEKSSQSGRC